MRVCTLALSIVAHFAALFVLVVVPLVATDVLPDPRRAFEFVDVTPIVAPSPPPARSRPRPVAAATSPDVAPLFAPDGVRPEVLPPPSDIVDADPSTVTGVPVIPDVAGGDPLPAPPPARAAEPVRVGGTISRPRRIHEVAPIYPTLARNSRVQGLVILEAVLDVDGAVREVRVLRSQPLLDQAAVDAVRQWRFTPTLLNGEPVPVVLMVTVSFTLQ